MGREILVVSTNFEDSTQGSDSIESQAEPRYLINCKRFFSMTTSTFSTNQLIQLIGYFMSCLKANLFECSALFICSLFNSQPRKCCSTNSKTRPALLPILLIILMIPGVKTLSASQSVGVYSQFLMTGAVDVDTTSSFTNSSAVWNPLAYNITYPASFVQVVIA